MIEATHVYKRLGHQAVLRGIDLKVHENETFVLMGKSGCGKSVFLKHVLGLLTPDDGEVLVNGVNLATAKHKERHAILLQVGMVFQQAALFDSLTVAQNVGFCLTEHKREKQKAIDKRVHECLEMVDLAGIGDKYPAEISGGMRKRVAFARAIAMKPKILLYDEPTTGLDPVTADAINDLMVKLKNSLGVTAIAVTHDMVSAMKIATRIAMMQEGKIHWVGTPKETTVTKNEAIREFMKSASQ